MLQFNWEHSGHKAPPSGFELLGSEGDRFLPFRQAALVTIPGSPESIAASIDSNRYAVVRAAMNYIEEKIKNHQPCNECFKNLPRHKTFKQIWDSGSVWISYVKRENVYGLTRGDFDIAVSDAAIREGKLKVVATIVHELAHINGVPGDATQADGSPNLRAESVLKCCLLANMFDPEAVGVIDDIVHGSDDARELPA